MFHLNSLYEKKYIYTLILNFLFQDQHWPPSLENIYVCCLEIKRRVTIMFSAEVYYIYAFL
jgi:hypothetical protein